MLRPMQCGGHALQSASFPLLPYSNRIGGARFPLNGKTVSLTPHAEATPHSLHGVGWERSWAAQNKAPDSLTLGLKHAGDEDWPFAFSAEQHFSIGPDWLEIRLKAINEEAFPVPLAFGHHPYFDSQGAILRFSADYFYPATSDSLPAERQMVTPATDFALGRTVAQCDFDNIYAGWAGEGWIEWEDRCLALHIESDLPHAVVYTPKDSDYFCFEPVPHISNALNRADGDMVLIAPDAAFEAYIRFSAITA
jgi:aldose 1-epimerase